MKEGFFKLPVFPTMDKMPSFFWIRFLDFQGCFSVVTFKNPRNYDFFPLIRLAVSCKNIIYQNQIKVLITKMIILLPGPMVPKARDLRTELAQEFYFSLTSLNFNEQLDLRSKPVDRKNG